ncbi:hypothetical protein FOZ60_002167 [Perkinsus olseni]|uniref:Protein kinase domain-containing protein n=1 Tax=Perkinsus olseni TaxID=32597 RepID=A0A7J6NZI5_PEROL|nr:hypothetical protein FOZ60_002167 [Perkinsus olseni]
MNEYRLLGKKGEGTFSEVLLGRHMSSNREVAIKYMKSKFQSIDAVNSFNEIRALRRLTEHPNIVKLLDVLYDSNTGSLALVLELMDMNVYEAIKGRKHYFPEDRVGRWMSQLLFAVEYLHDKGIFHRDIKPENLLLYQNETLKLADLGSCKGMDSKQPFTGVYLHAMVQSTGVHAHGWILFNRDGYMGVIWCRIGCVFFEVLALVPLFPGKNEVDQVNKIHKVMGLPPDDLLTYFKKSCKSKSGKGNRPLREMDRKPHKNAGKSIDSWLHKCKVSYEAIDTIKILLTYDAEQRPSATEALRLPYFDLYREAYTGMTPSTCSTNAVRSPPYPSDSEGNETVETASSKAPTTHLEAASARLASDDYKSRSHRSGFLDAEDSSPHLHHHRSGGGRPAGNKRVNGFLSPGSISGLLIRQNRPPLPQQQRHRSLAAAGATLMSGFGRQNDVRQEPVDHPSNTTRLPPIQQGVRQHHQQGNAAAPMLLHNSARSRVAGGLSGRSARHHYHSNGPNPLDQRGPQPSGRQALTLGPAAETITTAQERPTTAASSQVRLRSSRTMGHFSQQQQQQQSTMMPLSGRARNSARGILNAGYP